MFDPTYVNTTVFAVGLAITATTTVRQFALHEREATDRLRTAVQAWLAEPTTVEAMATDPVPYDLGHPAVPAVLVAAVELNRIAVSHGRVRRWERALSHHQLHAVERFVQRATPLFMVVRTTTLAAPVRVWNGRRDHAFGALLALFGGRGSR